MSKHTLPSLVLAALTLALWAKTGLLFFGILFALCALCLAWPPARREPRVRTWPRDY
jgi:hypothetical protein